MPLHSPFSGVVAASACCLVLLGACASVPVHVDAPALHEPLVVPLPLRIGVRVAPSIRSYVYAGQYDIRYDVGPAATSALLAGIRAGFADVIELPTEAGATPDGLDAILEFSEMKWQSTGPARFDFRLLSPSGQVVGNWATSQEADFPEVSVEAGERHRWFSSVYMAPATLQIDKAVAALLRDLRDEPAIRGWLEAHGAYRSAMPSVAQAVEPAPPTAPDRSSGLSVLSDVQSDRMRRCIVAGLRRALPDRPIISTAEAQQALFPWLTDRPGVGVAADRLNALWRYPPARSRLTALGIGAFVLVVGDTTQEQHGTGLCGAGQGGGGCLGLYWGTRSSVLAARVLDFSRPGELLESAASRHGTAIVPMFGLPLPFIPATAQAACDEVTRALAARLRTEGVQ